MAQNIIHQNFQDIHVLKKITQKMYSTAVHRSSSSKFSTFCNRVKGSNSAAARLLNTMDVDIHKYYGTMPENDKPHRIYY